MGCYSSGFEGSALRKVLYGGRFLLAGMVILTETFYLLRLFLGMPLAFGRILLFMPIKLMIMGCATLTVSWSELAKGDTVHFWRDPWCGDQPLSVLFPRLFCLASNKEALICDLTNWDGDNYVWLLSFRRTLFSWEENQKEQLIQTLRSFPLHRGSCDRLVWKHDVNENFSVNSLRRWKGRGDPSDVFLLLRGVWKAKIPPKVWYFTWQLVHGRLLVLDYLHKCNCATDSPNVCPFCGLPSETVDHLFIKRMFSWMIWAKCLNWWNFQ